jgi:hypothetical protein
MTFAADEKMLKDIKAGDKVVITYTEKDAKPLQPALRLQRQKRRRRRRRKQTRRRLSQPQKLTSQPRL